MAKYLKSITPFSVCLATGNENGATVNFRPKETRVYSDLVIEDITNTNYNEHIFTSYLLRNILTTFYFPSNSGSGSGGDYVDNIYNMAMDPLPYNGSDGFVSYCSGDLSNCFTYTPLSVVWEMSTDGWLWSGSNFLGWGIPYGSPGGWQPAQFISDNTPISYIDPTLTVEVAALDLGAGTNFVPNFIRATVTRPDNSIVIYENPIGVGTITATVDSYGSSVTLSAAGFTSPAGTTLSYSLTASNDANGQVGFNLNADADGNNQVILFRTPVTSYITATITVLDISLNPLITLTYSPPITFITTQSLYTEGYSSVSQIVDDVTWTFTDWVLNTNLATFQYSVYTGWPTDTLHYSLTPSINYTYSVFAGLGPFYSEASVSLLDLNNFSWIPNMHGTGPDGGYFLINLT